MKTCPFCAEEIQDAAIKCKHCGEFLDGSVRRSHVPSEGLPFFYRTSFLVFTACMVGPFMLPLVWMHPKMSRGRKTVISLIVLAISAALGWSLYQAIQEFRKTFEEMEPLLKEFGAM